MAGGPPGGTVTFLVTDIEDAAPRWEEAPDAMAVAVRAHDAIVRDAIETLAANAGQRTLADLTACGARLISTSDALALVTKSHAAR